MNKLTYNIIHFILKDALNACGGLNCVLSLCTTDFDNPFAREWALFCVRNACDGNEQIRSYIESMKPQDIIITDQSLIDAGLRVAIDSQTGKLKVTEIAQSKPESFLHNNKI